MSESLKSCRSQNLDRKGFVRRAPSRTGIRRWSSPLWRRGRPISGVLDSRDTQVMIESLRRLGCGRAEPGERRTIDVARLRRRIPAAGRSCILQENSGTSIRFLTALCSLEEAGSDLDGNARMRERPIAPLVEASGGEASAPGANSGGTVRRW